MGERRKRSINVKKVINTKIGQFDGEKGREEQYFASKNKENRISRQRNLPKSTTRSCPPEKAGKANHLVIDTTHSRETATFSEPKFQLLLIQAQEHSKTRRRHHSCFEVKYLTVSLPSYWRCFVPRGIEILGLLKVGRKMARVFIRIQFISAHSKGNWEKIKWIRPFTLYELYPHHVCFTVMKRPRTRK